mmetsp:Transcript_1626/g.2396  ORF Transcript_1626/g.2396 Transcript_1626/m.2396 type:complete len:144 (+) Transcript_1626:2364-2795(+)
MISFGFSVVRKLAIVSKVLLGSFVPKKHLEWQNSTVEPQSHESNRKPRIPSSIASSSGLLLLGAINPSDLLDIALWLDGYVISLALMLQFDAKPLQIRWAMHKDERKDRKIMLKNKQPFRVCAIVQSSFERSEEIRNGSAKYF